MSTVTWELARWVAGTRYEDLPPEVVRQARRFFLDALGCALGGFSQEDCALMREVTLPLAGPGPCALLVTGQRVDPLTAALHNALMIRVMDYNDIYWKQDPSHPSDLIPAALATAELAGGSGRDLVLGIVLAYELEQRLCEVAYPGIREQGWHHATLTAAAAPLAAGRMLGLSPMALQHAVGISASRHGVTGSVTAGKLTMMKNTVDPLAVQSGVLAALLARRGYTGPEHVLDGKEGLAHVIPSDWHWEVLTAGLGESWRILDCGMKFFPTEALTHTPLSAVLELVQGHGLQAEEVERVTIRSLARAADILADPEKYDPRSKETADHSLPYVVAAALADGEVTPRQFVPEKIADPRIRAQLRKVEVIADPDIEAAFPALQRARVTIRTTDGRTLTRQLDFPRGDPRNPLSDAEIEAKVRALAEGVARPTDVDRMLAAVGRMETFERVDALTGELAVDTAAT